jgi:hypothetical protein
MLTFSDFFKEEIYDESPSYHVEAYFWPDKQPIFRILRTEQVQLNEGPKKPYRSDEPTDTIDDHLHKTIGNFKPSSLDHQTIANEFHNHLAKHGYYMHSDSHPNVMSPKDQLFKAQFKRLTSTRKIPQHEMPHQDGDITKKETPRMKGMGRFVGVWSTNDPTHIFHKKTGERIHGATSDGKVTIFNDSAVKHAASGETNRWFVRAGEIRRIPKNKKIIYNDTEHNVKDFIKNKKWNTPRHQRDVTDYFKRDDVNKNKKREVLSWIKKNHPKYDPTSYNISGRGANVHLVK